MNFEELKLKNQICHRIYSVNNGIQRLYRPILSELGLTYVQYVILMALWEKDHVSMGELASLTKLDKGFLTTTIEKMKQDSLVKLVADKLDQRKKIVLLTKKGISLKHRARCIPSEVLNLLYSNDIKISKKDIETFINVLDKMNLLISES
jgi:DNA-binding MarR family transcriptional regulator